MPRDIAAPAIIVIQLINRFTIIAKQIETKLIVPNLYPQIIFQNQLKKP